MKIIVYIATRMAGDHSANKSGKATLDVTNCPVCGGVLIEEKKYPGYKGSSEKEAVCGCGRLYDMP